MDVQLIFNRQYVTCQGGASGLWLDSYERTMHGSSEGPVIEPGDFQASRLYQRITGRVQPHIPLGGVPLSPDEINIIQTWIA